MFDRDKLDDIRKAAELFEESTQKSIRKRPERKENFMSASGDEVGRVFSPVDVEDIDYMEEFSGTIPVHKGSSTDDVQRPFVDNENVCRICNS